MRRLLLLSLIFIISISMVVGCSKSTDNKNENAVNDTGASQEKTKIEFWSWVPKSPLWPEVEKAFEDANPDVDVEYVITESKPDYEQKLKVAMASGQGPDVIGTQFGALMNSYSDQLEPLEAYAKETWGDSWIDQFKAGAAYRINQHPGVPALPAGLVAVPLVMYDVDMFEKAGASIPATYEDLKEVLKKFEAAELPGVMPHVGFGGGEWGPQVRALFYNLANQVAPLKLYDADAGKVPFTDPDLVKAASLMKQYADDNIFQPGYLGNKLNPDVQNELFENKAAIPMFIVGSWGAFDWTKRADYHIEDRRLGYFPLPTSIGDKPNVQVDVDLAVAIPKSSKNKDAAWKFVKFMSTEGYQEVLSKALQNIPAAKAFGFDKTVLTVPSEIESLDIILNIAETSAIGVRALENPEIETALYKNLQAMMSGTVTPEQAMKEVEKVSSNIKR